MAQEFGRIERPYVESFQGRRKLFLVPRLYEPPTNEEEANSILQRYWEQIQSQVASLESRLGAIKHIYHEGLTEGGKQAVEYLETIDQRCNSLVHAKSQSGATLESTEDFETLGETLDLQRCLMLPLTNINVARKLQEWFAEGIRKRYEYISKRIDETLGKDEIGLLIINERHQVQFPADVEVIFVAPPALDEFHRWLDVWIVMQQTANAESGEPSDKPDKVQ
jgi:hypothetical protein